MERPRRGLTTKTGVESKKGDGRRFGMMAANFDRQNAYGGNGLCRDYRPSET